MAAIAKIISNTYGYDMQPGGNQLGTGKHKEKENVKRKIKNLLSPALCGQDSAVQER